MRRRDMLAAMAASLATPAALAVPSPVGAFNPGFGLSGGSDPIAVRDDGWITDVDGIKVGHFTEKERPTGCTVILCEPEAICGVFVPGGWPGTRLTDMLDPVKRADGGVKVSGVVLTGGSDYGLSSASGVEQFFRERYFAAQPAGRIPKPQVFVVPGAVIYDLSLGGDWRITPTAESGYKACQAAAGGKVAEGCVGAGAGAMVGHWGENPTKSGLGTSSIRVGSTGIVVGAICVVNASGDVYNPKTGEFVSGSRTGDGKHFSPVMERIRQGFTVEPAPGTHTTIAAVATNARFSKTEMAKIAQMASAALARCINPAWGPGDGDTVFAISTGTIDAPVSHGAIGAIAAEALTEAILRAVIKATGTAGVPAWRDMVGAH